MSTENPSSNPSLPAEEPLFELTPEWLATHTWLLERDTWVPEQV